MTEVKMNKLPKLWVVKLEPKDTDIIVRLLRDSGYTHGIDDEEFPKDWAENFANGKYKGEPCIYSDGEDEKIFTGSIYRGREGYELFTVEELFDTLRPPLQWWDGGKDA